MEKRLGKVITNRRKKAPFEGMAVEPKEVNRRNRLFER